MKYATLSCARKVCQAFGGWPTFLRAAAEQATRENLYAVETLGRAAQAGTFGCPPQARRMEIPGANDNSGLPGH